MNLYKGKFLWPKNSSIPCLHCNYTPINFTPIAGGISRSNFDQSINTIGPFCSLPCARAYLDPFLNDTIEKLTTEIMDDMRKNINKYDSIINVMYLQTFKRFSEITLAPPREIFESYGGNLTYKKYHEDLKSCIHQTQKESNIFNNPSKNINSDNNSSQISLSTNSSAYNLEAKTTDIYFPNDLDKEKNLVTKSVIFSTRRRKSTNFLKKNSGMFSMFYQNNDNL